MSLRSSSRRKGQPEKVTKKPEEEIDLVDDEDDEPSENGVGSDDDVIELPEGTVVVNPEPVDDSDSSKPKSAKKRQKGSSMSMSVELNKLMSRILCTACGKQINPNNTGAVRRHPWLKVITCKKCYKFLKSGPIQKDKDGLDEQCRWCGEGGRLYGCDYCHNSFCRPCVKRNLGRSEAAKLEESTGKWKCYVCKPYKLKELVENCNKVMEVISKEEEKERLREERAREREREAAKKKAENKGKEQDEKEKEKEEDKKRGSKAGTPTRTSLRAPVPKSTVPIVIKDDKVKSKDSEPIVIPDSSSEKSSTSNSNQEKKEPVVVVVGPKAKQPVTMPYAGKTVPMPRSNDVAAVRVMNFNHNLPKNQQFNNPNRGSSLLLSAIQQPVAGNAYTRGLNIKPHINDLYALSQSIFPYNVDNSVDKLIAATQALSLTLNGIKTDIAIAKLTNENMFNARQSGANSLKSGLHVFLNSIREIFNVQIRAVANSFTGGSTPLVNGKASGTDMKCSTPLKTEGEPESLDVSDIPILVDDSPMKKSASEPVIIDNKPDGSEDSSTKDDSCIVVSQNDDDKSENETNSESSDSINAEGKVDGKLKKVNESSQKIAKQYEKLKEKVTQASGEDSENIAAQLELLKEMADELTQELDESEGGSDKQENAADDDDVDEDEDDDEELEDLDDDDGISDEEEQEEKKEEKIERKTRSQIIEEAKAAVEAEKNESEESSQLGSPRSLRKSRESRTSESSSLQNKESETDKKSVGQDKDKDRKDVPKKDKDDSSEKSPSKSKSDKSPTKPEPRSSRSSSKRDDSVDSKEESVSLESRTSRSKSKKDEPDIADKDSKSVSKKSKSEAADGTEIEDKVEKSEKKVSKSKDQEKDKKGKAKAAVTEIVTDEESTGEEGNLEEGEDENLDADSDGSEGIEIDETTRKKKSTKAKKSAGSAGKKGKGKDDKSVKGNKSKTSSKKVDDDNTEEEYKSDSSNFDPELEKQIKGVEKALADGGKAKTKKKGKEEQESDVAEKKGKKEVKGKKKGGKSKGADSDEELSSGSEEENAEEEEEEPEEEEDEDNLSPAQLRKLRAAREAAREKEEEEEGEVNMEDNSEVSSDPEVSFPKIQSPTKKGQKKVADEMSEDSDFEPTKKKKRLRSSLLDAKLSESDSEEEKPKKGKGKKGGKRKRKASSSEEEEEEEEEDEDTEDYSEDDKKKKKGKGKKGKKGKGKKRRRIKRMSSSDEEGGEKEPGEDDQISDGDDEDDEGQGGYLKRKKIRKVMKNKKLTSETKRAQKAEEERRKRIEERQKEFNSYVEVEGEESEDEVPEGVEREKGEKKDTPEEGDAISKILGSPRKVPVTTKLILEMDKEKKKPLIEVERTLIRKLKPHQVDAVRFIYNCTIESIERMKKEEGSGAIVAHCMGLGKTLSVITFVHTMLRNVKVTKMSKCLVVCPLNTVLNWVNEFEIWLDDVDFEIEVYELSQVKMNSERANMLKDWHSGGAGVMILGYDMYRNLIQGSHCKNKKQKAIFYETLADPGPDLVVCDEGHILKNDATSISKSMNKIKSRRRIVLTGTPLQNNLGEYHCMVNFVKPNLLGTRKEFGNRFVNPITNGQCTDSSPADVKLMKRRAHILHEMLAGCVQRKDYSALTKFLPPKFEYVISVRLAPVQMELYQKYLDIGNVSSTISGKGARLFKDYQALMRIWTHPWVLKLDEIRQENKPNYSGSEDSFIDDEGETDEDSFISDGSSSSEGEVSPVDLDSDASDNWKKKGKGKGKATRSTRSTRSSRKKSGSSDEDSDKPKEKEEVVRKWTSRRRGNEEGAGASWMDIGVPEDEYVNKDVSSEWWAEYVKEEDRFKMELSGKLVLLFEILKMCEDIGDKVLVFSQSLLSLDIIEDFLHHIDEVNQAEGEEKKEEEAKGGNKKDEKKEGAKKDGKKEGDKKDGAGGSKDEAGGSGDAPAEKKEDKFAEYGKNWTKGADYFRMDGSTNAQNRKASQNMFNDEENFRARLFLISTKAGSLGINLVAANRVIIFDASWNPSHDIQSIFRVYRFGQVKPVYVYRFLAQGTMEEKIYERQVTKQSLSQRVVDEHQIERHFTSADLAELYRFTPDRLDDPNRKEKLPMLPKDHMLAELMTNHKEWIVTFHEHDSLLENVVEQELTDEEKKAAWEDYEEEKKGLRVNPMINYYQGNMNMNMGMQGMMNPNMFQNLLMQGQHSLGPNGVLRIVQDLKNRFPNLPPDMFQQRVQAVLRQILTQQIMQQSEIQRRQLDQQQMTELNRLHQIKQQIQRQQQLLAQQRTGLTPSMSTPNLMTARGSSSNLSGATNQNQR